MRSLGLPESMLLGGEQPLNLPNTADAADAQGEESAGDAPSAKRRKDGAHGGGSSAAGAEATAMEADGAGAAAPAGAAVGAAEDDDNAGKELVENGVPLDAVLTHVRLVVVRV